MNWGAVLFCVSRPSHLPLLLQKVVDFRAKQGNFLRNVGSCCPSVAQIGNDRAR